MNEKIITYKKLINDEISKIHFSDKPKNLYEPLKYILSLKSKRLRPTLSILSYKLFQNEIDKVMIILGVNSQSEKKIIEKLGSLKASPNTFFKLISISFFACKDKYKPFPYVIIAKCSLLP